MILPDVLQQGLRVVFCGTAASSASAKRRAYYAGPGNRFWATLHRSGLTPRLLEPEDFALLPAYGIGLTDLCKGVHGNDTSLAPEDYDLDGFHGRILKYAPKIVAFNGLTAARILLANPRLKAGQSPERLGDSRIYILPSSSGAASGSWDEGHWFDLAERAQRSSAW